MIHGIIDAIKSDTTIFMHWCKGEDMELQPDEEKEQRIELAAFRMLAAIAMVFTALWALKLITFAVSVPGDVLLKLAFAVSIYAVAHDVFIMSENANQQGFTPQKAKPYLFGLFKGQEVSEAEQARKFSHGTLLQPIWMWLYVNRNRIGNQGVPKG